jgi:hypothetical protein
VSTASKEAMEALHGLLAEHFSGLLNGEGEVKAADLNVIRQFLKDNNINAQADRPGTPFNTFVNQALPFMEDAVEMEH